MSWKRRIGVHTQQSPQTRAKLLKKPSAVPFLLHRTHSPPTTPAYSSPTPHLNAQTPSPHLPHCTKTRPCPFPQYLHPPHLHPPPPPAPPPNAPFASSTTTLPKKSPSTSRTTNTRFRAVTKSVSSGTRAMPRASGSSTPSTGIW